MNLTSLAQTAKTPTSRYTILDRETVGIKTVLTRWESLLAMLLVAVFVGGSVSLPNFFDLYNLLDATQNFSEKALIALPMALLIICREIDISVAGTLALSSVAMGLAKAAGCPPALLPVAGIATGAACGLLNGVMWIIGGVFVLIWLYLLQIRKDLLGSPFGPPPAAPSTPTPPGE